MKITKEENGNIRISGLNLLGKLKKGKTALKSKKGEIKEKETSDSSKYRITREDNKIKIKKEKEKEVQVESPVEVVESAAVRTDNSAPSKITDEEIKAIYNNDVARASTNGFTPTIRDGYVTYWEIMNGSVVKRFGKYADIKDKSNIAIRKSDVREIELVELGRMLEEKISILDSSNTECPEYIDDIETAKRNNNNEVPSMREGYITYYEIVGDRLIKRFGKYDEVISNDNCYIKYRDRYYYKKLQRKMKNYNSSESERQANANLDKYNNDLAAVYGRFGYYPTPREGYITYYKDNEKRYGKYEDVANDSEIIIDEEDRENAEDYVDLERQIANLKASIVENDNQDLEESIVEEPAEDDLDLEEKIVEETERLLYERDSHQDEQVVEEVNNDLDIEDEIVEEPANDDIDLEERIVEETERLLDERDNSITSNDYGRLEDLSLSDDEKEYFEKLAEEYIGYLENPTEFKFEKEYKVRSKY